MDSIPRTNLDTNSTEQRWAPFQQSWYAPIQQIKKVGKNRAKMDSMLQNKCMYQLNRAKVGIITAELVGSNTTKKRSAKAVQRWTP